MVSETGGLVVSVWTNLLHRARFFGSVILLARPIEHGKANAQNQSLCPIKKQLETLLFVFVNLNKICGFHFNVLLSKDSAVRLL